MRLGKFICFVGPVCSSKSDTTIREARRALAGRKRVVVIKPERDDRDSREFLETRDGVRLHLKPLHVQSSAEVLEVGRDYDVVIIDEGQWFNGGLRAALEELHRMGKTIYFVGLDLYWTGQPWETTSAVTAIPEAKVVKLPAYCSRCGSDAGTRSQKLEPGGAPVPLDAASPLSESGFHYRPLCLPCWLETTPGAEQLHASSLSD